MLDIETQLANLEKQLQHIREVKADLYKYPNFERDKEVFEKLDVIEKELEESIFRLRNLLKLKQVI